MGRSFTHTSVCLLPHEDAHQTQPSTSDLRNLSKNKPLAFIILLVCGIVLLVTENRLLRIPH